MTQKVRTPWGKGKRHLAPVASCQWELRHMGNSQPVSQVSSFNTQKETRGQWVVLHSPTHAQAGSSQLDALSTLLSTAHLSNAEPLKL